MRDMYWPILSVGFGILALVLNMVAFPAFISMMHDIENDVVTEAEEFKVSLSNLVKLVGFQLCSGILRQHK